MSFLKANPARFSILMNFPSPPLILSKNILAYSRLNSSLCSAYLFLLPGFKITNFYFPSYLNCVANSYS